MLIGVIACIADQFVLCHIIVTIKHHVFAAPIGDSVIRGMVGIGTDTIHATSSCTEDTAENEICLFVIFWQNLKGAAIDGDGALTIERVVDFYVARMTTTHTTAIKFGNDYAVVIILETIDVFICRIGWVEQNVGSTHECIQRNIIYCPFIV